jgi:hypothetical protein
MLVTNIRVRTTSPKLAPARPNAASRFLMICTVCAYASPTPMIFPSGPVAVVPETLMWLPIRTAREYPTIGSHFVPVAMFWRGILVLSGTWGRELPLARMLNLKEVWHSLAALWPGAGTNLCAAITFSKRWDVSRLSG